MWRQLVKLIDNNNTYKLLLLHCKKILQKETQTIEASLGLCQSSIYLLFHAGKITIINALKDVWQGPKYVSHSETYLPPLIFAQ